MTWLWRAVFQAQVAHEAAHIRLGGLHTRPTAQVWRCIPFGLPVWAPEICLLDTPLGPRRLTALCTTKYRLWEVGQLLLPVKILFIGEGYSFLWISGKVSLKCNKILTQRWPLLLCIATLAPNMPAGRSRILDQQFPKEKSPPSFPYRALYFLGHGTSLISYCTMIVKDYMTIFLWRKSNNYWKKK